MWGRQLFILASFVFLLAAIPFGVYLVKQQQDLNTHASSTKVTNIEIISPDGQSFKITNPLVRIQLNYVPLNKDPYPTSFKVATSISGLATAAELPFQRNAEQVDVQLDHNPGPKTIYVQFKVDNSWSTVYSVSTVLDVAPTASLVPVSQATPQTAILGATSNRYDLNHDGKVNDLDAKYLQLQISASQPDLTADLNGDHLVNLQDYALLLKHLP